MVDALPLDRADRLRHTADAVDEGRRKRQEQEQADAERKR